MAEEEKKQQKAKLIKKKATPATKQGGSPAAKQIEASAPAKKRRVVVVKKKKEETLSAKPAPQTPAPTQAAPVATKPAAAPVAAKPAPEVSKKPVEAPVAAQAPSAKAPSAAAPTQDHASASKAPVAASSAAKPAPEAKAPAKAEPAKTEAAKQTAPAPAKPVAQAAAQSDAPVAKAPEVKTPEAKASAQPKSAAKAPSSAKKPVREQATTANPAVGPGGAPIPDRSGLDPTREAGRMVNISWVQRNIQNTTTKMNNQGGARGGRGGQGGPRGGGRGANRPQGKFEGGRPVRDGGRGGQGGPRGGGRGPGGPRGGQGGNRGGASTPPTDMFPGRGPSRGRGRGAKSTKNDQKAWQQKDRNRENFDKLNYTKKQEVSLAAVPEAIDILEAISIAELAKKMNLKASEIIKKLMQMGEMVSNQNQQIDAETATLVADEFGCKVNIVSLYDETIIDSDETGDENLVERAPIVTVMGHVDHGKTKLLDSIRNKDVAGGEFGGITQHIGAYKVKVGDNSIVFLDTPGHAAFTHMRSRGAQVTDVVVLVVAANDGVMPQTIEAINHAKAAEVPIVVAVNKIDLPEANPDRIKQQLSEYELIPEEWGGSTIFCEISALKNQGIDELLESILIQTEVMELKENAVCRAEGKVLEAKLDPGRGNVADVIVQRGTLRVGDPFVAGVYSGRVRAIFNDHGDRIEEAGPSTPVEVTGLSGLPAAGSPFQVTETEKEARQVGAKRQELERYSTMKGNQVSLDNLFDTIQQGAIQSLKVIIKSDVQGSAEALKHALQDLSTDEIKLTVIHANAGAIVESDVSLAAASEAIIIAFNVRPTPRALDLAETEKVEIRKYNVIYDAVDDMHDAMEGMLAPELREEEVGTVEVRETFKVPKIGVIAGCYVTKGKIKRKSTVHVIRDSVVVYEGVVTSLKRFKDDAKEVLEGFECGVGLEGYQGLQSGDILEVFEVIEIKKTL